MKEISQDPNELHSIQIINDSQSLEVKGFTISTEEIDPPLRTEGETLNDLRRSVAQSRTSSAGRIIHGSPDEEEIASEGRVFSEHIVDEMPLSS